MRASKSPSSSPLIHKQLPPAAADISLAERGVLQGPLSSSLGL